MRTGMTHTPGPWQVESGMVQTVAEHKCKLPGCGVHIPIAYMDREPGNGTLPVERDANAHLIAAAPELLAVVKSILAMIDYCPDAKWFPDFDGVAFSRDSDAWKNAETAIAKAEGRQ